MILVLDPHGRRVRTMAPRRAQEKVARGRAAWCHQPRHLPDRRYGTILLGRAPRDPVPERAGTLLLDAHGVPLSQTLHPRVARELVQHPERWVRSDNGRDPLVTVVGTLRDRRWPRCLMLTQSLTPRAVDELLLATAAGVVDEAIRLRTLQQTLERLAARAYGGVDLSLRQLERALGEIARLGDCEAAWPALAHRMRGLVAPMGHHVLSRWRDDPLRILYATLWVLSRLTGQPDPFLPTLAGLRADLAGMRWPEALAIVAEAEPAVYAAWAGAHRGRTPGPASARSRAADSRRQAPDDRQHASMAPVPPRRGEAAPPAP
ncbi:MAG: hypothetical protein K6U14_10875 [Firmicutes bacterium]|nr:hypothetical protein [Alicyclobacillaceae bacterium]MCL6498115.1 hypothetical protein [Bacillota bacterium]